MPASWPILQIILTLNRLALSSIEVANLDLE